MGEKYLWLVQLEHQWEQSLQTLLQNALKQQELRLLRLLPMKQQQHLQQGDGVAGWGSGYREETAVTTTASTLGAVSMVPRSLWNSRSRFTKI